MSVLELELDVWVLRRVEIRVFARQLPLSTTDTQERDTYTHGYILVDCVYARQ